MAMTTAKKPRNQKSPRSADDGLRPSPFPGGVDDGISPKPDVTDWTELPDCVVDAVSRRLPIRYAISMGLTCKSWRRVLSDKTTSSRTLGLPWQMHVNDHAGECFSILEDDTVRKLYFPEEWGRKCLGSIQDWLVVTRVNSGLLEVFFYNPFSMTTLTGIPPSEIHHYYKIVVSTASPADENCVCVLLHRSLHDIACWTRGIPKWCRHHLACKEDFDDAVFCNGRFYFVTKDFNICTFDINNMTSAMEDCTDLNTHYVHLQCRYHRVKKPNTPMTEIPGHHKKICSRSYLVESGGEVLLVLRLFPDTTICAVRMTFTLRVFKLDTDQMRWTKMESLGGRVVFLGNSDTRSLLGQEGTADCIFCLTDPIFPGGGNNEWINEYEANITPKRFADFGIFTMEKNTFDPFQLITYPINGSPVWITAPIWWYLGANDPASS